MTQYAICDAQDWVSGFVHSDSVPEPDGRVFRAMTTALPYWPESPAQGAKLKWEAGGVAWVDGRTLAQAWADVRAQRASRFKPGDDELMKCVRLGIPYPAVWADHQQGLADVTLQADPFNIIWPTPPSV